MHRKELSVAQREQIIGAYISGVKQKVISAQLDIPTSTINDTIKQYKETGFATPEKCPSCPKLLTQFRKYLHDEGLGINKCNTREMGKISIETLHHLILSLPDCVKAVIKAKALNAPVKCELN
ncbi:11315_t:CDS:2 [Entrophospora sp. SA101]|nr:11315_t:CDS:2 [Entrophospora sp. SA101]